MQIMPPLTTPTQGPTRYTQKEKRAYRRTKRKEQRIGEVALFSGPVEIGAELRALIVGAREVKSKMTHRPLLRATCQGSLGEYGSGNIIVVYDKRALCGRESAEILRTNSGDIRIHIRRGSPMDSRAATPLDVDRGSYEWGCLTQACQRLADEG